MMQVCFQVGDSVVYPFHGVGTIVAMATEIIAGSSISLYVIDFTREKMTVRIPESRAVRTGLRHLSTPEHFAAVIKVLGECSKANRTVMWAKRSVEYINKINSGDVLLIAEVLRDLHPRMRDSDCSFSEKSIYEQAMDRLSQEYAASLGITVEDAKAKVLSVLHYSYGVN